MKILKFGLILFLTMLFLAGCDEDSKNTLETDFPTNFGDLETVMMFIPQQDFVRSAVVDIWTSVEVVSSSLTINDELYDLDWDYYSNQWYAL